MKAAIPDNELERLNNLLSYNILDTPSEQDYDEIVSLASQICEVPISLITFVDKERQWFKAKIGIQACETSRDISFCAHAILQDEIFEIEDALQDFRFFDNPEVTGGIGVRFYAGAPLKTPESFNIGTLCVVDSKPKKLTLAQKEALRVLAKQVVAQLELRRQFQRLNQAYLILQEKERILSEQKQIILDSIYYAETIQKSLFVPIEKIRQVLPDALIFFRPRDIVSGDFYFFHLHKEKIFFATIDCTGHGVPGAFISILAHNALHSIIECENIESPELILNSLEKKVVQYLNQQHTGQSEGMDITICTIDISNQVLEVASARNPLFIFERNTCTKIPADRISIGGKKHKTISFTKHIIATNPEQVFYMFSDGYAHQFDRYNKNRFMLRRLITLLSEIYQKDFDEQEKILSQTLQEWKGNQHQTDDILIVGFKVPTQF
ncbi:MAG: SpoIIE family protein phosphatase [Cytophagales bacterium]|nr:SpoIIE family protein phosphatase [Cytophagales bacterium]MDW8384775.1 SpoIIE family protein phosphatase [Flammeovirgaceae bacterium]